MYQRVINSGWTKQNKLASCAKEHKMHRIKVSSWAESPSDCLRELADNVLNLPKKAFISPAAQQPPQSAIGQTQKLSFFPCVMDLWWIDFFEIHITQHPLTCFFSWPPLQPFQAPDQRQRCRRISTAHRSYQPAISRRGEYWIPLLHFQKMNFI